MTFKPMLAPNEKTDLNNIEYPQLASYKLDGIRGVFYKGEILSRSLKQIQNKQLRAKFELIRKYSEEHQCILDGEFYSPELTFQEITRYVMTKDFEDPKSVKKFGKVLAIPSHLKFYCFDIIGSNENIDLALGVPFIKRLGRLALDSEILNTGNIFGANAAFVIIKQELVNSREEVEDLFEKALADGEEGLILRDPEGRYKCGRGTIKEGLIYKVKPFISIEARVTGFVQATKVDPSAEKKINELGRSLTSRKKNDRILIEKAAGVTVDYKGKELKVTLSLTDEEKSKVWKNQDKYVGKWIEYKYLEVGMKEGGLPRHPTSIRWRLEKD